MPEVVTGFAQTHVSGTGDLQSPSFSPINLRVGISFISSLQAKRNIPDRSFDEQLATTRSQWNELLGRIRIEGTIQQKRMFYTALYHTMLMPSDRTGENPSWNDGNLVPRTSHHAPRKNDSNLSPLSSLLETTFPTRCIVNIARGRCPSAGRATRCGWAARIPIII
jgi:putative alpha-1,2-mannosidase